MALTNAEKQAALRERRKHEREKIYRVVKPVDGFNGQGHYEMMLSRPMTIADAVGYAEQVSDAQWPVPPYYNIGHCQIVNIVTGSRFQQVGYELNWENRDSGEVRSPGSGADYFEEYKEWLERQPQWNK